VFITRNQKPETINLKLETRNLENKKPSIRQKTSSIKPLKLNYQKPENFTNFTALQG
jgi:hypothetical protein